MRNFTERVAVVTGSASGIGRATAVALAKRGCDLALVDVQVDANEQTAAMVRDLGRRATVHRVDVSKRDEMEALAATVIAEHGRVDIVVNNAGVTTIAPFEEHTPEDFEWVVGVNLWGVVHGCRVFLPHLRRADEAYLVNLSSVFGLIGVPEQTSYCLTKFAVRGFGEALGAELVGSSVRVLTVHPGGIATNIVASGRWPANTQERRAKLIERFARHGMPPERAAERIVEAMRSGKTRLLIAAEAYAIDAVTRSAGPMASRMLGKVHELLNERRSRAR